MLSSPLRPAVFLDRDGVIIENRADHVKSIPEVRFIPGALEALARLAQRKCFIVIVTNQAAIGRGLLTRQRADEINAYVLEHITAAGGRIDAIYLCPHLPEEVCVCRKPAPGMLLAATRDLGIDLRASVMIGDALTDIQAAQAVEAQPFLVRTGRGAVQAQELSRIGLINTPTFPSLVEVVDQLLEKDLTATDFTGSRGSDR